MSLPIIEYVALDITAAINAISEDNGFNQDLTALRPRRNDFSDVVPEDGLVVVWQADAARGGEEAAMSAAWMQSFALMAIVLDSDAATDSIDIRINQVAADIEKKLNEDVTRGGYAIDTQIDSHVKFSDEGFSGVSVNITVHYRTEHNDPYTQI